MSDSALVVLCTAPDDAIAASLARRLVAEKLAACVNLLPAVRSFYVWNGEIQDDAEVQLVIKTRRSRYAGLEAWLTTHHPYDVPEILALEVGQGAKPYLKWLHQQT